MGIARIAEWFFIYLLVLQEIKTHTDTNLMYKASKKKKGFFSSHQEIVDLKQLEDLFDISINLFRSILLMCE